MVYSLKKLVFHIYSINYTLSTINFYLALANLILKANANANALSLFTISTFFTLKSANAKALPTTANMTKRSSC